MPWYRKFCQRGSNFDNVFLFLVYEGRENTTISGPAIIGPSVKCHLNGISLACR